MMKKLFIRDSRLREIIADRNKKIEILLLTGKLRGSLDIKLSTKQFKGETFFGWEITDLENGQKIEERLGETQEKVKSTGEMTALKDYFKPIDKL